MKAFESKMVPFGGPDMLEVYARAGWQVTSTIPMALKKSSLEDPRTPPRVVTMCVLYREIQTLDPEDREKADIAVGDYEKAINLGPVNQNESQKLG